VINFLRAATLDKKDADATHDALAHCIDRLRDIIDAETRILKQGGHVDFDALNQRKTHALLEFLQVSRAAPPQSVTQSADRIQALRKVLSENAQLLERRLQATQEITNLIVHHIRESESDGTYSIRSPGVTPK
jgi:hypothetical protein